MPLKPSKQQPPSISWNNFFHSFNFSVPNVTFKLGVSLVISFKVQTPQRLWKIHLLQDLHRTSPQDLCHALQHRITRLRGFVQGFPGLEPHSSNRKLFCFHGNFFWKKMFPRFLGLLFFRWNLFAMCLCVYFLPFPFFWDGKIFGDPKIAWKFATCSFFG